MDVKAVVPPSNRMIGRRERWGSRCQHAVRLDVGVRSCQYEQVEARLFLPAESIDEAIARIFALTGASASGTRGEKRAVVALRDALGLDVDLARTNVVMGRAIADKLEVSWNPAFENRNRLTLTGLNALLQGATAAYERREFTRLLATRPAGLDGPEWADFVPAPSKIEAVNRISQLTGSGPEWLGPGSKEHKSVLINLARGLAPHLDMDLSKTKLGAALAREFDAPWGPHCESTGETISLTGLNVLLAGAERRCGRLGQDRALLLRKPGARGRRSRRGTGERMASHCAI